MKSLLIRNFKLRRYTLLIYALLLVCYPIYTAFESIKFYNLLHSFISATIFVIWILDAGHLFRLNRRLGGNDSYYFYMSLPVSKKQLLNANYITCIVLTLLGTLVISLYAYRSEVIEPNSIYFSTAYAFVISNFLSIPIAFSQFTELRRAKVSYGIYVFTVIILVPFLFSIAIVLVNYFVLKQSAFPELYSYILNIGFLVISIVILIVNYFKQLKKIST
ncbi:phenol-soluble modulin export ABC transporter permease subunit PmtB [Staphylococcus sp. 30400_3112M30941]|nr:phenol-soluble modulin export ABC transporter permease subunit PmtB [Staphylococcus sp. 30403_3112M30944]MBO0946666.1 phenol-soluble modulin export ABC transporter permease subunit PmtB [Staphylococcus sp. 30402_3112M30943]MBO0965238.1 phenol-soluble modulin export ABC transporter permease subunit PmtB [Staphylococcus sp. 30400_3112M30941]MBO0967771.1 phenol-soluble modulin export ABC transporter permease subunit PmtB [Staphylococcus sp. 30401_3112M30942]